MQAVYTEWDTVQVTCTVPFRWGLQDHSVAADSQELQAQSCRNQLFPPQAQGSILQSSGTPGSHKANINPLMPCGNICNVSLTLNYLSFILPVYFCVSKNSHFSTQHSIGLPNGSPMFSVRYKLNLYIQCWLTVVSEGLLY